MPADPDPMDGSDLAAKSGSSHLFLVRLWTSEPEDKGDSGTGQTTCQWEGRVHYILSGEAHNFRGWQELAALVQVMAQSRESDARRARRPDQP